MGEVPSNVYREQQKRRTEMKRLVGDDLQRIDSTPETLEKWYDFLEQGAKNIGYGPNVYEHLRDPYSKGIPLKNNGVMDLDESGRAIFKLSMADKLSNYWTCIKGSKVAYEPSYLSEVPLVFQAIFFIYDALFLALKQGILSQDKLNELYKKTCIPQTMDIGTFKNILADKYSNNLHSEINRNIFDMALEIFKEEDTKLYLFREHALRDDCIDHDWNYMHGFMVKKYEDSAIPILVKKPYKDLISKIAKDAIEAAISEETATFKTAILTELADNISYTTNGVMRSLSLNFPDKSFDALKMMTGVISDRLLQFKQTLLYINFFNDVYDFSFNYRDFNITDHEVSRSEQFNHLFGEDYLVISQNPIDKLMCSTKQAFGSCLSLAKEGDNRGATGFAAGNGLGLFALMPSESVYLTFLTNGKHKNMYWEEEEWNKDPSERDKSKAYKYFKMTMRQLTYKGIMDPEDFSPYNTGINCDHLTADERNQIQHIQEDPKLYPARQYSVVGELTNWELAIQFILAKAGIATGLSYVDEISNLRHKTKHIQKFNSFITKGITVDNKVCWYDAFAKRRGIYFDNLRFSYPSNGSSDCNDLKKRTPDSISVSGNVYIKTGTDRTGNGGVTESNSDCRLDAFKFLRGEQSYSYFDKNIKICKYCGKLVSAEQSMQLVSSDGSIDYVCTDCTKAKGYRQCETCGEWYLPEEASEHELIDIKPYIDSVWDINQKPTDEVRANYMMCKSQLKRTAAGTIWKELDMYGFASNQKYFLSPITGKIFGEHSYNFNGLSEESDLTDKRFYIREIKGIKCKIKIEQSELHNVIICDGCKKMIYLGGNLQPMMIIPGKKIRILCKDCMEKIRIKKEEKASMVAAMKAVEYDLNSEDSMLNRIDLDTEILNLKEKTVNLGDYINNIIQERKDHIIGGYSQRTETNMVKDIRLQLQCMTGKKGKGYPEMKDNSKAKIDLLISKVYESIVNILKKDEVSDD